jgi:hypothetical protein
MEEDNETKTINNFRNHGWWISRIGNRPRPRESGKFQQIGSLNESLSYSGQ